MTEMRKTGGKVWKGNQKLYFGHANIWDSMRLASDDVYQVDGHSNLKLQRKVWSKDNPSRQDMISGNQTMILFINSGH